MNAEKRLFNINDLVVGNVLNCEKDTAYTNSKSKFIFEKSNVNGQTIYRDTLSNTIINEFSNKYDGPYITNIEALADYFNVVSYEETNQDMLLSVEDILDIQAAVNMIAENECKNKIKQKSL